MTDYIKQLCDVGGKVYVVGGAVRNYLYNYFHNKLIPIKDYDFVVFDLEEIVIQSELAKFGNVKPTKLFSCGITLFNPFGTTENIEFAMPRKEISIGGKYKDFEILPNSNLSLTEDFSRRDATINAIGFQINSLNDLQYLNISSNNNPDISRFTDPFEGIHDIKQKCWKAIGDPLQRFSDDPTRIIRAFRQSGELDLYIELETLNAIKIHYNLMKILIPQSYVRLFNELLRLLKSNNPTKMLKLMNDLQILNFLGMPNENFEEKLKNILKIEKKHEILLKFSILLSPENIPNIKDWIHDRQLSATSFFSQFEIHVLMLIQMFYHEIINAFNSDTIKFSMLIVRNKSVKIAHVDTDEVLFCVLSYINIKNKNINVEIINELKRYPLSVNNLEITGDDLKHKWNIQGKMIGKIKNDILNEIFNDSLKNTKDDITQYINLNYK